MPFKDASFDLVVVVGTLQYLLEPSACVREVNRILKPEVILLFVRGMLSFNVLRRPISFLCCVLLEGFEWGGRAVSTSVGTSEKD